MTSNGSRKRSRLRWALTFGLLATSYLCLFFFRHLSDPDEGRYAEIPREMLQGGHWFRLTLLGYPYYEKPPLTYWSVATALKLFGVHDWAVRFPLFLGLGMLSWCGWRFVPRTWSSQERLVTYFVLLTTLGVVGGTSYLTTDAILLVFFTLTCMSLYNGFQTIDRWGRRRHLLIAGLCGGLGVLTKGAVAILLPGGIALLWLLIDRRENELSRGGLWGAGLLAILVAAPILYLLDQVNPGFLHQFIFEEHIARFLGTRTSQLHAEPFWFYLAVLPLILLPWSLFIPRLIATARRKKLWRTDSLFRFLTIWAGVVVIFFSMSRGKLISYILPAVVPIGLLLGRWGIAEPRLDSNDQRLIRIGWTGPIVLGLLLIVIVMGGIFQWLPEKVPPFSPRILLALLVPAVLLLASKSVRTQQERGCARWGASVSGMLFALALILSPLAGSRSLTNEAAVFYQKLAKQLRPEDQLAVGWDYCPSLAFYTQRVYRPLQHAGELRYGMTLARNLPGGIETTEQLAEWAARGKGRTLIVVPSRKEKRLKRMLLPFRSQSLPRDPERRVFELPTIASIEQDFSARHVPRPAARRGETYPK